MYAEATKVCGGKHGCGRELPLSAFNVNGYGRAITYCRKCGSKQRAQWRIDNMARQLYRTTKRSAEKRGLTFELSLQWFEDRLATGTCEISGVKFVVESKSPFSPSPDRIDNDIGYVESNCRMIVWSLNNMKSAHAESDFQECLRQIAASINEQARTH
jgi:hypothetical protein